MAERYGDFVGCATKAIEVTPHNSNELVPYPRAIYIGGTGNVKVTTVDDSVVTFSNCPSGLIIPIAVKLVWATGTSATGIVGMI